jgi:predicted PurR-regulated permease PerM
VLPSAIPVVNRTAFVDFPITDCLFGRSRHLGRARLGIIQIGPSIVLIPLIIRTWMTMTTALLFTAYMVPINLLDDVLRPSSWGHGLSTPMPVILLVVIGGTISHGITGLFLGPIVLAVFWELLVAWLKESETAQ